MNFGNFNWHNWSFDHTEMKFLLYFRSLQDYWHPSTLISLVNNSWGEMVICEKRAFQLLKMRKRKFSWNIKTKCVTDFFSQLSLTVWRIVFVITWWTHKRQKFKLITTKSLELEIFCLLVTGYLNTKNRFQSACL